MVYRRGTLKVMLGPEHMQVDGEPDDTDTTDSHVVQLKPQQRRQSETPRGYGKIGETNVYKRTRPFQAAQPRPKLDRYPSGLELSGQKVDKEDNKSKSARSVRSTLSSRSVTRVKEPEPAADTAKTEDAETKPPMGKDSDNNGAKGGEGGVKTAQQKPKNGRHSAQNFVSQYFLTDFGLHAERTDTFSGHHRRRGVASADLERQMEEKAEKHIRTCQLMGNVRRGCKAQLGYQGLRHAVSPRHVPGPTSPDPRQAGLTHRELYRSEENLNKTNSVPYMIQLRKSLGSISKTRAIGQAYQRHDPLPAITCRTLMVGSGLGV